jgi:hypothetical protein
VAPEAGGLVLRELAPAVRSARPILEGGIWAVQAGAKRVERSPATALASHMASYSLRCARITSALCAHRPWRWASLEWPPRLMRCLRRFAPTRGKGPAHRQCGSNSDPEWRLLDCLRTPCRGRHPCPLSSEDTPTRIAHGAVPEAFALNNQENSLTLRHTGQKRWRSGTICGAQMQTFRKGLSLTLANWSNRLSVLHLKLGAVTIGSGQVESAATTNRGGICDARICFFIVTADQSVCRARYAGTRCCRT